MAGIKPIGRIRFIGKRGTEQPFPISGQKGLYFYILENHAKRLEKINEAYKSVRGRRVDPLESVKVLAAGASLAIGRFCSGDTGEDTSAS